MHTGYRQHLRYGAGNKQIEVQTAISLHILADAPLVAWCAWCHSERQQLAATSDQYAH